MRSKKKKTCVLRENPCGYPKALLAVFVWFGCRRLCYVNMLSFR